MLNLPSSETKSARAATLFIFLLLLFLSVKEKKATGKRCLYATVCASVCVRIRARCVCNFPFDPQKSLKKLWRPKKSLNFLLGIKIEEAQKIRSFSFRLLLLLHFVRFASNNNSERVIVQHQLSLQILQERIELNFSLNWSPKRKSVSALSCCCCCVWARKFKSSLVVGVCKLAARASKRSSVSLCFELLSVAKACLIVTS